MIRVLLSVLAVVTAVLAFIIQEPLLYAAAAVLLLVAVILLVGSMRQRHREARKPYVSAKPNAADDELKALGIMEIRPRADRPPNGASVSTAPPPEEPSAESSSASFAPPPAEKEAASAPTSEPVVLAVDEAGSPEPALRAGRGQNEGWAPTPAADTTARQRREAVLLPHLQALQAALGAYSVCLLRQDALEPQYRIEALVSVSDEVQRRGSFRTTSFLLTPTLAERAVTVRHVGDGGIPATSLGFYRNRPSVREVALAPVPRPSTDTVVYLLLADAREPEQLSGARARAVLSQFARLTATLLDDAEMALASEPDALSSGARPRSEIIAEEMEAARAADRPLALALVYLNEAEAAADRGDGFVAAKERILAGRLEQAAAPNRVERFGELTYGVFYPGADALDAWALNLQQALAQEDDLAGGVSIGVALLHDHHTDPSDFRADATEALREAYESGTCVIVE